MKIDLFLPFPPTINSYYTKTRNGVYLSKRGRTFHLAGIESIQEQLGAMEPIEDGIHLSIIFYPPDSRIRDLDNYIKPVQDVMTKSGVYKDDSLIHQLAIYQGTQCKPKGLTFVRLRDCAPILSNTAEHRALI